MLRGCARRTTTSAIITNPLRLRRGYADDRADLYGIAKQIEEKGIKSGNPGVLQNPRYIRSRSPPKEPAQLPANFVPFEPHKPYNPYDFMPQNRLPPTYRRFPLGAPPRAIAVRQDVFHQLDIDPLDEVLNCALITHNTTEMGRIQKRSESKLTWRSQRKMGKAIRRARAMGLIPMFSRWKENLMVPG